MRKSRSRSRKKSRRKSRKSRKKSRVGRRMRGGVERVGYYTPSTSPLTPLSSSAFSSPLTALYTSSGGVPLVEWTNYGTKKTQRGRIRESVIPEWRIMLPKGEDGWDYDLIPAGTRMYQGISESPEVHVR